MMTSCAVMVFDRPFSLIVTRVMRGDDEKPSQWRTSSEMAAKNPEDFHPSH
jgi:hypothetical protein